MSDALHRRAVRLGDVDPARSRHAGKRSAVTMLGELVVTGTATGAVVAHDLATLDERWRNGADTEPSSVVAAEPLSDGVVVGERSPEGRIRYYDATTGELRWRYATSNDLGGPQKPSRFFLPYVADIQAVEDRVYVASRRYERDGRDRSFTSVVYAFDLAGDIVWMHSTDASPVSLDFDGDRLAVAYNRCPGSHQHGLVVLDAGTGTVRYEWDPGTDGQRRVGDVSLVSDGVMVASHGDYRGYRLRGGGAEQWCVDLASEVTVGDETVYAYPNHVHATAGAAVFVTGNTYSTDGRETTSLHPREHTALGYTLDGEQTWTASVGGFATELGAEADRVAVPGAQHFRTRDGDVHGLRTFGTETGLETTLETDGIVTAVAVDGDSVVAVVEPVVYHDEGEQRGTYRLLVAAASR